MASATMTADAPDTTAAPAATAPTGRPRMRKRTKIMLIVFSVLLMGFFRTGFLFIMVGLMPSIIAYYVDTSRKRYLFKTIFACNLSGLMPFIGQMLHDGPTSSVMAEIMGNMLNWVIIYGAALVGLMMVRIAPIIAEVLIGSFHTTQITRLAVNQKRIENEWGPEVTQFSKKDEDDTI